MSRERIQQLQDDIDLDLKADNLISDETKQWAIARLQDLHTDIHRVTRENAYEDFLLAYLQEEREKFKLYKQDAPNDEVLEGTPYDEVREQPVCLCDGRTAHRCPLKRGVLPREVRNAADIDDGIRAFRGVHSGNPIALTDGQDAWAEEVAAVLADLRTIGAALSNDSIPTSVHWNTSAQPAD